MEHIELGKAGEDLVCQHLMAQGLVILARNWRHGRAELDIIAKDAETLVFVEVKTRRDNLFESPAAAVGTRKRQLIIKAAMAYQREIGHDWLVRFDIASVLIKEGKVFIDYDKAAFFPGLGL